LTVKEALSFLKKRSKRLLSTNLGAVAGQEIVVDGVPAISAVALSAGLHGVHVYNICTGNLALTNLIRSRE